MPLVSRDWQNPSAWDHPSAVYAFVRDGEELRWCRENRAGGVESGLCPLMNWREGDLFRRLQRDRRGGARVAVGLPPHLLVMRELISPLRDAAKSEEIWESLLDAAVPFSLEPFLVCLLPPRRTGEGGWRCLAVAARIEDLRAEQENWRKQGIDPDLMIPEALALCPGEGARLWRGRAREVWAAWSGDRFLGAGDVNRADEASTAFRRFQAAWAATISTGEWQSLGPGGEADPLAMERGLCRAARGRDPHAANLLAGELAPDGLRARYQRKWRTVQVTALCFAVLLVLGPLWLRLQMRNWRNQLRTQVSSAYEELTGTTSTAPGQEPILALRFMESEWTPLRVALDRARTPVVAHGFSLLSRYVPEAGLRLAGLRLDDTRLELEVEGDEESMRRLQARLKTDGWVLDALQVADGRWQLRGGLEP
jgi:hypothetical protein